MKTKSFKKIFEENKFKKHIHGRNSQENRKYIEYTTKKIGCLTYTSIEFDKDLQMVNIGSFVNYKPDEIMLSPKIVEAIYKQCRALGWYRNKERE